MLYYGLLVSLFLEYVRPGAYIGIIAATKIGTIIPLLVFLLSIAHKGPVTNGMFFSHSNTKWLLYLLFLLVLSTLTAVVTVYSYTVLEAAITFLIWHYTVVKIVTSPEKLRGVFFVLAFSHFVVVLLNPHIILDPTTRSYIFGNPYLGDGNDFSLSVCIVFPMTIYLLLSTQKKYMRIIYLGVLFTLGLSIIGTQSRGAALALGMLFLYMWWDGRQKILGILLIATAVLVIMLYAPSQFFSRMETIRNYQDESSAQTRIIAWGAAVRMALYNPVLGVGAGHFPINVTSYQNEFNNELTAHSMYFLILGELGFPGIIFLLSILMTNFFRNRSLINKVRGSPEDPESAKFARMFFLLNGSLIGFSVAGAFLSVAYYPHLYILTALFSATHFMYLKHQKDSKEEAKIEQPHPV